MDIAGKTSDPTRALENLLRRDEMFTSLVEREAQARNLPVIEVREGMTVEDSVARVVALFGLDGAPQV